MAKKNSKHRKNKKNNNNKGYKKIAFIVVLILIIIIAIKNNTKLEKSEKTQIIINNENRTNELVNDAIQENENIYISYEDIQKFIDPTIYKENETNLIITTSSKKIATLKEGEDKIEINGSEQKEKDAVIKKGEKDYLAISELENVYDYEFKYEPSTNIVTIDNLNKKLVKAYAKSKIKVKEEANIFSKTVDKVEKGNWLIYIGEENGFAKIRTQKGKIGYVKEKKLNNFVTEREDFIDTNSETNTEKELEYDISKKDITTYEKRKNIINLILQEAIKNDKMYVKIIHNGEDSEEYNRFKIEIVPMLKECGIKVEF